MTRTSPNDAAPAPLAWTHGEARTVGHAKAERHGAPVPALEQHFGYFGG